MGSGLAQRPIEKVPGFPLVLALCSTRTHHNLSMNVAAQSMDVTFTAQQERQWLQELHPATDPLVPNLVLQVHLRLDMAVGKLVLLEHQSKERLKTQLEGSTVRKAQPCQRERRKDAESDVSWQCHVIAGNASSSLACQSEKIPLRKVSRISLCWTGIVPQVCIPKKGLKNP